MYNVEKILLNFKLFLFLLKVQGESFLKKNTECLPCAKLCTKCEDTAEIKGPYPHRAHSIRVKIGI